MTYTFVTRLPTVFGNSFLENFRPLYLNLMRLSMGKNNFFYIFLKMIFFYTSCDTLSTNYKKLFKNLLTFAFLYGIITERSSETIHMAD